jgi:hypothetical protein
LFDILRVLRIGVFLLPKQMLYQAELRPDRTRPGLGGPGMVTA